MTLANELISKNQIESFRDNINKYHSKINEICQEPYYKKMVDEINNLDKMNHLINSIKVDEDSEYYNITSFKNFLSRIQKLPINYDFILSFIYYNRIYGEQWSLRTCIKNLGIFLKYEKGVNYNNLDLSSAIYIYNKIINSDLSKTTKSTEWRVCKQFFRYAGFIIDLSPFKIKLSKNQKKAEDLITPEEFKSILNELGNHRLGKGIEYMTFFMILAESGCRIGEVFSIHKKILHKLKDDYRTIINGKTGEREILLHHSALLIDLLIKQGWKSWTINYASFRSNLKAVCKRLNIDKRIYPHLLRHNFNSYTAVCSEVTPEIRKTYTGYSKSSTVYEDNYIHFKNSLVVDEMRQILLNNPLFN